MPEVFAQTPLGSVDATRLAGSSSGQDESAHFRSGELQRPVALKILGSGEFICGDEIHPFPSNRPMQLAAYLAVRGGWVQRSAIATMFWPDRAEHFARSNLRNLLHKVHHELPLVSLELSSEALRWRVDTDLAHFNLAVDAQDWTAGIRLGARDLLLGMEQGAGPEFLNWLQAQREACLRRWRHAVREQLRLEAGNASRRGELAALWVSRCPDDEEAVRALIDAQLAQGLGLNALATCNAFNSRMSTMLDLPPVSVVRGAKPADAYTNANAHAAVQIELPAVQAHDGMLVGRTLELRQLRGLLAQPAVRVVTVTGMGGVGKTTLARRLHLALAQEPERPEKRDEDAREVLWLDAASLRCVDQVLAAAAGGLGLQAGERGAALARLKARLHKTAALLFIDGADHLPGLGQMLHDIAQACPLLQVLVTSRRKLGCEGEWLLVLEGLPLPDADEREVDALLANDSVRLFSDSIRRTGASLDLASDGAAVVELVTMVEGLPLALCLLAGVARYVKVGALLQEMRAALEQVEPQSAAGIDAVMPQIAASFATSYAALSVQERTALQGLAVFPAAFGLNAAKAVADATPAMLMALVDSSLVRPDEDGRYCLHAAVRWCALAQNSGDKVAKKALVEHYGRSLLRLQQALPVAGVLPLRRFIRQEWPNIVSAWNTALALGCHEGLIAMTSVLGGQAEEMESACDPFPLFERALSDRRGRTNVPLPNAPLHLQACLLSGVALGELLRHRYDKACEHARSALKAATSSRNCAAVGQPLYVLACACAKLSRTVDAERFLDRAQAWCATHGDERYAVSLLLLQAISARRTGKTALAISLVDQVVAYQQRVGDSTSELRGLIFKAVVCLESRNLVDALRVQQTAERLLKSEGIHRNFESEVLHLGAEIHCEMENLGPARAYVNKANELASQGLISPGREIFQHMFTIKLEIAEGLRERALQQLPGVLERALQTGADYVLGICLLLVARWYRLAGEEGLCSHVLQVLVATSTTAVIRERAVHFLGANPLSAASDASTMSDIAVAALLDLGARAQPILLSVPPC